MTPDVTFGEFRFDDANQCLWRGAEMIGLTPKSYGVLRCLIGHAGQLVTKDVLLDTVWPDTAVTDASLKVCVQEIRRLLGDPVSAPRYIATVHGRGYRFIAPIAAASPQAAALAVGPPATIELSGGGDRFVGREQSLAALLGAFARAAAGTRQVVFLAGEAGIGKTTLADRFLDRLGTDRRVRTARGRALEQVGAGEPYLPLLDALGRLCRAEPEAVAILRARAPTWLAQMPWLIAEPERRTVEQEVLGGTPARMLRELAEGLEALAAERPLVLALEDLHWSDPATIDALALLAQRPEPARLLVLLTYRPVDAILDAHPVRALKQRLAVQGQCSEMTLDLLTPADVDGYLAARLDGAPPPGLAEVVHRRTEGNPLFMVTMVDGLLANGRLVAADGTWRLTDGLDAVAAGVPESVRLMVEQQAERLEPEDLALLETAALAGIEFAAAMVAAALALDPLAVEQRCETLARRAQWVTRGGDAELPDGSLSTTYRFTHDLYRGVLAQRLPTARRAHLHLGLGNWLETALGERAAAELALHFEQGRDLPRAVRYLRAAARTATTRCAHREALALSERALALSERLDPPRREPTRRALLEQRGVIHRARGDVAAAVADFEAWAASARAAGERREEVRALLAMSGTWSLRDRGRGLAFAEQAVALCESLDDPALTARTRGSAAYWHARVYGWRAGDAEAAAAALAAARRADRPAVLAPYLGMDAQFANLRGDYAAAAAASAEGLALAERAGDSFSHALCRFQQTWALQHLGDWGALLATLRDALHAAERNGHQAWTVVFRLLLGGWLDAAGLTAAGAALAEPALAAARAAGHEYGIASGLLVTGWSALGNRAPARAQAAFDELAELVSVAPTTVEWVLRLPMHIGLSACALVGRDPDRARAEAVRAESLAAISAEPTYLGLAHRARAAAAMAERRWEEAATALAAARAVIERAEAPIAAWQVWTTAAALARSRKRAAEGREHEARAAAVLDRLAASLDAVDDATAVALGVSIAEAQASIRGLSRQGAN